MPFSRYLPFLADLDVGQAEWQAGEAPGPLLVTAGEDTTTFAALICFEAIFADLARQAVGRGSRLLVNITNDGWFGETAGPRQHAELARLRGLECGVPVVRCANNGISFVTDENGRVMAYAGLGERRLISASIEPAERATLFVYLGAWPLAGLLAVWCVLTLVSGRGRRSQDNRGAGDEAATRPSSGEQS
jgi:apolipoprotein N-acyltransferase